MRRKLTTGKIEDAEIIGVRGASDEASGIRIAGRGDCDRKAQRSKLVLV